MSEVIQTQPNEVVREILGIDSHGNSIHSDDLVLGPYGPTQIVPAEDLLLTDHTDKVVVINNTTPEPFTGLIDMELCDQNQWLDLDSVMGKNKSFWRKINDYYLDILWGTTKPKGQETLNEATSFTLGGTSEHVSKVTETENFINISTRNDNQFTVFTIPKNGDVFELTKDGIVYLGKLVNQKDASGKNKQLVAFAKLTSKINSGAQIITHETKATDPFYKDKLKEEFPWLQEEDLNNHFITSFSFGSEDSQIQRTDLIRLKLADPARQSEIAKKRDYVKHITRQERSYLASKNYARLVEFSYWFDLLDTEGDGQEKLTRATPRERYTKTLEFISSVEEEYIRLAQEKWSLETELFGERLSDPFGMILDRFISKDTMLSRAVGFHNNGIINLSSHYHKEGKGFEKISNVAKGQRKQLVQRDFAEILCHENKHVGFENAGPHWTHEEIWTEFIATTLPTHLRGDTKTGSCIYDYHPLTKEIGGSLTLLRMYKDLLEKAGSDKLKIDEINRSVFATGYSRQLTGEIQVHGKSCIGFQDLYNNYFGDGSYQKEVAEYSDEAYSQNLQPLTNYEKVPYPHTPTLEKILSTSKALKTFIAGKMSELLSQHQTTI